MIAGGIYLGLRDRPPPALPPAPSASAVAPSGAPEAIPPTGAAPSVAGDEVMRRALGFLDRHREQLTKECWLPSLQAGPGPSSVRMKLDLSVSAEGRQIIRGMVETRGASRPDVSACVQRVLPPFELGDVGAPQHLEVPLSFP